MTSRSHPKLLQWINSKWTIALFLSPVSLSLQMNGILPQNPLCHYLSISFSNLFVCLWKWTVSSLKLFLSLSLIFSIQQPNRDKRICPDATCAERHFWSTIELTEKIHAPQALVYFFPLAQHNIYTIETNQNTPNTRPKTAWQNDWRQLNARSEKYDNGQACV